MDYGQIERQSFKTYLAFSGLVLSFLIASFAYIFSSNYRVSEIRYNDDFNLDYTSLKKLVGSSIWLVSDGFSNEFYADNPTVEKIVLVRKMPTTLIVDVTISEELAFISDGRMSPPQTFVLYKNLYRELSYGSPNLIKVLITNGPVDDGFFEEIATFVLTLKKYPINLSNVSLIHNGSEVVVTHFDTLIDLGGPFDLARKGTLVGYYLSEMTCSGEIRLVYTDDGSNIKAVKNCN